MSKQELQRKIVFRLLTVAAGEWKITKDLASFIFIQHNVDFEIREVRAKNGYCILLGCDLGRTIITSEDCAEIKTLFQNIVEYYKRSEIAILQKICDAIAP